MSEEEGLKNSEEISALATVARDALDDLSAWAEEGNSEQATLALESVQGALYDIEALLGA